MVNQEFLRGLDNERCHRLALYQPLNPDLEPAPPGSPGDSADDGAVRPNSPALQPDRSSPCSNVLFTHIISQSDIVRYAALPLARAMGQPISCCSTLVFLVTQAEGKPS